MTLVGLAMSRIIFRYSVEFFFGIGRSRRSEGELTLCSLSLQSWDNPVMSHRSKHLDVRMFKTRQFIADQLVNPLYCPTACNLADFWTKSLDHVHFDKFRNIIMNVN